LLTSSPTVQTVVVLLLLASLVGAWVGHLRIPYTVGLVLVGLAVSLLGILPSTTLDPNVVLTILIPPLLFEAAFSIQWHSFVRVAAAAIALATVGVVVSGLVTAGVMVALSQLDWRAAVLFGFVIAATDPVAVVALFRRIRVTEDLRTLIETESMLNDGTVVVVIGLLTGFFDHQSFQVLPVTENALFVILGGMGIGSITGVVGAAAMSTTSDYLVETTLSLVVAYGSYILAQEAGASGILAAVAAGIVLGNVGRRYGVSRTTRHEIERLWEFLAFLANSIVFLLLGVAAEAAPLLHLAPMIGIGVFATLLARTAAVYLVGTPARWISGVPTSRWQQVLSWGGLRGALPVVVAYLLPASLGGPDLPFLVLGVVLVTLTLQGLTLEPALSRILRPDLTAEAPTEHAPAVQFWRHTAKSDQKKYDISGQE